MEQDRAAQYREKAAATRKSAETTTDPSTKKRFEYVASLWMTLAAQTEADETLREMLATKESKSD